MDAADLRKQRLKKGGELKEKDVGRLLERQEGPKDGEIIDFPGKVLSKLDEL